MTVYKKLLTACIAAVILAGCGRADDIDKAENEAASVTSGSSETAATVMTTVSEAETTATTTAAVSASATANSVTAVSSEETEKTTTTTSAAASEASADTTRQTTTSAAAYATSAAPQNAPAVTEAPAPAETQPEESSNSGGSGLLKPDDGEYSYNGYPIEVRDGVTYVNGILIANKSYSLPKDYGSGLTQETQKAFNNMQADAANDGISLFIVSGFRSYAYQDQLYWGYVRTKGQQEADRVSARAGHSEHQTGLALDVNNASYSFTGSKEAAWLAEHCAEYGFIIRYPEGKEDITGYKYEPWHIRYLGIDTAREIYDSGLTLEEYLGIDSYYH